MKLIAVCLPENKPKELRLARRVDLVTPVDDVLGWRVLVRGPAVIVLSPAGVGHEFARSACVLVWEGAVTDYDKLTTFTSEPMTRVIPGVEKPSAPAAAKATA